MQRLGGVYGLGVDEIIADGSTDTVTVTADNTEVLTAIEGLAENDSAILDSVSTLSDEVAALAAVVNASTYSGSWNSTVLGYMDRSQDKIPVTCDYVAYRDGQYSYKLVWGDLSVSGGNISGNIVDGVSYTVPNNYNNYYTFGHVTEGSFSLSVGSDVVYSNLGNYPTLGGSFDVSLVALVAVVVIACIGSAIWKWWSWTIRGGSDNGIAAGSGGSYRSYD